MSRIVTFYSYKGGVGRTFALANIAVLLARRGKKVLLMDWDLEAPGLSRYFSQYTRPAPHGSRGLMHLLAEAAAEPSARWQPYVTEVHIPDSSVLHLIESGDQSADYVDQMRQFSWPAFFEKGDGGGTLDRWRGEWKSSYDFVLIDSRTGLTDTGGVCTIYLPDILVLVFAANEQSFERGVQVVEGIQRARAALAVPRPPLAVLPVPGRFDGRDEVDEAQRWLDRFDRELKPFYDEWLPNSLKPRQILELTKVPYLAKFSFGEPLAVITHGVTDPEFPGYYLDNIARLLASDFADAPHVVMPKSAAHAEPERRVSVSRISDFRPTQLVGRDAETAFLNEAWQKTLNGEAPRLHVVAIVAWAGLGKTSLVARWTAALALRDYDDANYFDWSFYSQGTRNQASASADTFLDAALRFFGQEALADSAASHWDKGARLAQLMAERRTLLVLDGLEPLQHPPGPFAGELKEPAIAALLKGLAQRNAGLCVITTSESVRDLGSFVGTTVSELRLATLSDVAGAELLHAAGVRRAGAAPIRPHDSELLATSREFQGHPLSLRLLGQYLAKAHGGDVRRRDRIDFARADSTVQGGHAFRTIAAYEKWLSAGGPNGERQLAVLRLLGLFDRPASEGCMAALRQRPVIEGLTESLVGIDEDEWNAALVELEESQLLTHDDSVLDAHPLIREYFAQRLRDEHLHGWQGAHSRLFDYLKRSTEYRPNTVVGLQPLYQAIVHGCSAGRHEEACRDVYLERILQGDEFYSQRKLGAFGADLGALVRFFDKPWSVVSPSLSEPVQAWLLDGAAFCLRALGRLTEAVEPMRTGLQLAISQSDWNSAARYAENSSELGLTLGDLTAAVRDAEQAVEFADRIGADHLRIINRARVAAALHQSGHRDDALEHFRVAEAMQAKRQPDYPLLYSLRGFLYCDLLLVDAERWAARGQFAASVAMVCRDVEMRAIRTLAWGETHGGLLEIALDHLTLSRARFYVAVLRQTTLAEPQSDIEQAVDGLRRANARHHIPRGLLTRAWLRSAMGDQGGARADLDEAQEIAARGPMPLFLADIALYRGRLFRSRDALKDARRLIEKHGYWRRRDELEDAEEMAKSW